MSKWCFSFLSSPDSIVWNTAAPNRRYTKNNVVLRSRFFVGPFRARKKFKKKTPIFAVVRPGRYAVRRGLWPLTTKAYIQRGNFYRRQPLRTIFIDKPVTSQNLIILNISEEWTVNSLLFTTFKVFPPNRENCCVLVLLVNYWSFTRKHSRAFFVEFFLLFSRALQPTTKKWRHTRRSGGFLEPLFASTPYMAIVIIIKEQDFRQERKFIISTFP